MTPDSAAGPGAWADEEAGVTGEPVRQIVHVDGTPMSALVLAAPQPRAVLVALHGGAVTSAYYDATYPTPHTSLLRVAAALGYTAIALDRPGYGSSAAHQERMATPAERVDLAYGAVERLLDVRPGGAGVFLAGHSAGCMLVTRMAADPRGAALLGLELAGIGLSPHADAAFMMPLVTGSVTERPQAPGPGLQEALWKPRRLYPPRASLSLRYAVSPVYEGSEVRNWVGAFPGLAALVRVPVHYTVGDHERVWSSGPAALAQVGALFTASPRVVTVEQADAAHNLSLGWTALSYHLKVLSFLEECVVARQRPSLPMQPRLGARTRSAVCRRAPGLGRFTHLVTSQFRVVHTCAEHRHPPPRPGTPRFAQGSSKTASPRHPAEPAQRTPAITHRAPRPASLCLPPAHFRRLYLPPAHDHARFATNAQPAGKQ